MTDRLKDNVPECNFNDPASLEAWYGGFAFVEHWRKVVLANCKEIERAKAVGEKITETRLDDLARLNPLYLEFLTVHLQGRTHREENVIASLAR